MATPNLGCVPSPPDLRDYPVAMRLAKEPVAIPTSFRLTGLVSMPPTYEQVGGSCVPNAFSGMAEWHERNELGTSVRLDAARYYLRCKELDGYDGEGTFPRVALDIWKDEGIYTTTGRGPVHQRISAYYAVPLVESSIASTLYQKKAPVALSIWWPREWYGDIPTSGIPPKITELRTVGGHQVWVWGYDFTRPDKGLLCRNSWGKNWGLNGSFWMRSDTWDVAGLPMEAWFPESQP